MHLLKKTIILTGIGGNTAQGIARSLKQYNEYRLVGVDSDRYNLLLGSRYVEKTYLVPPADSPNYISKLNKIVRSEKADLLIPSPDPEVYTVSKYRDKLETNVMLPDHNTIEICQDKWTTYNVIRQHVYQPPTILIQNRRDILEAFTKINPPLWVRKRRGSGGSRSLLVYTPLQARVWIDYWDGYGEFITTKLLRGRNLSWIGLYNKGRLVLSGGYLRLRYFMKNISPTGVTGNINLGVTIHDDKLNSLAEDTIKAIDPNPHGVYTVDVKAEDKYSDSRLVVTEVNAGRLHMSAYIYTIAGLNIPYFYVKHALGEDTEKIPPRNSVKPGYFTIRSTDNEPIAISFKDITRSINTA